MTSRFARTLLLGIAFPFTAGALQGEEKTKQIEEFIFTATVPEAWTRVIEIPQERYTYESPDKLGVGTATLGPNITFTKKQLPAEVTVRLLKEQVDAATKDFPDNLWKQLQAADPRLAQIQGDDLLKYRSELSELNGVDCLKTSASVVYDSPKGPFALTTMSVFLFRGKEYYAVTVFTPLKMYPDYKDILEKIYESIAIGE